MYELLSKKGLLFAFLLGLAVVLLFYVPVLTGVDAFNALPEEEQTNTSIFDLGLWLTIILVVIAALAIIGFSILSIAKDIKGSLRGLVGLGVILLIFIIGYAMTGTPDEGTRLASVIERFQVSISDQQIINGALFSALGILILTAVAFVFGEISSLLK
ncbi:MAG TPA: hypothetical protein VJ917_05750 [Saprospiraceae bacterium]|nr:hypothetical protein [Saprospiraceae bacterium]